MSQSLKGKVAIVTGASRGIGAGVAKELAKRGASLVLTYVASAKKAEELVKYIESEYQTVAIAVQADCSVPTMASRTILERTLESFPGGIDIIVNNAANGDDHALLDVTEQEFSKVFNTNVLMPLLLIKECRPYLKRKARVVNVGSVAGRRAYPSAVLYAASKSALESITRSLAFDLGREFEATVNVINPGPVATDMWANTPGSKEIEALIHPLTAAGDRIATVEDIAPIVAFLCEEQSRWITGNVTCANGGFVFI